MFFKIGALKKSSLKAGIAFSDEGIYLAVVNNKPNGEASLEALDKIMPQTPSDRVDALKAAVHKHKLDKCQCNVVMNHHDYAIYPIDAPPVPAEELSTSAKWSIKDLIDYPVEKAVVDTFDLPQSSRVGAQRVIQVVAANSDSVRQLSEALQSARVPFKTIDICELALHNVSSYISQQEEHALTFIYEIQQRAFVEISRSSLLYLTRSFPIYASNFAESLSVDWATDNDNSTTIELCLEIQRSMDFFESQYTQGKSAQITNVRFSPSVESIMDSAAPYLSTPIESVHLSDYIQFSAGLEIDDNSALLAVGAALREAA